MLFPPLGEKNDVYHRIEKKTPFFNEFLKQFCNLTPTPAGTFFAKKISKMSVRKSRAIAKELIGTYIHKSYDLWI